MKHRLYCLALVYSSLPPLALRGATPLSLLPQQVILPAAKVATSYSYSFAPSGGTPPYTITTTGSIPGLTLSAAGLLSGTPLTAGYFVVTVQAADSGHPSATVLQRAVIQVGPQDLSLPLTSLPSSVVNAPVSVALPAVGGVPPYSWALTPGAPAGFALSAAGVLSGTPSTAGQLSIPVRLSDHSLASVQQTLSWRVDTPLTTTASAPPLGFTNQAYPGVSLTAQGGEPESYSWSVAGGALPAGMSLSRNGVIGGTPAVKGSYDVTVRVNDGLQAAQRSLTINVYDPLVVVISALPAGTVGQTYGPVSMTAAGGSGSYIWSAMNLPAGLSLSASGQLTGSPTASGSFTVVLTLNDSTPGLTASKSLPITVATAPMHVSGGGNMSGVAVGSRVSMPFAATGGKPPYTWSADTLPAGLSLDPSSGMLTGSASQAGNFSFSVRATDAQLASAAAGANLPVLGITTSSISPAVARTAYSFAFAAAGGTPPYAFSATGIPPGMTFSSQGTLAGPATTPGTYALSVVVADSKGVFATSSFNLTVGPAPVLTVTRAIADGMVGSPYSGMLTAAGGGPAYVWSVGVGTLPPGLSATGALISGIPSAAGIFTFSVQVTDSNGLTGSGSVTMHVAPPMLTLPLSSLPDGIAGAAYPLQVISPTGGLPPYSFSISSGALPGGLTLVNGQISGSPLAAGTSNFTLAVMDSGGAMVSAGLRITIKPKQAGLVLSSSAQAFSLATGATGVPDPKMLTVRSSAVDQLLSYGAAISAAAPWLNVTGSGTTPGMVGVGLNSQALLLAPGNYQASVAVTCMVPSPCAGSAQTVTVSLQVTSPPPQLSVMGGPLSFSVSPAIPKTSAQTFALQNKGGGSLDITSVTAADRWLSVSAVPAKLAAGPMIAPMVSVDPTGLAPGYYRSSISIVSSAGSAIVPVMLLVAQTGSMMLSPSGLQFTMMSGGRPASSNGSFGVRIWGAHQANWTASVMPGADWLKVLSVTGTSTDTNPGNVTFMIDPAKLSGMTSQVYYGTIRVISADVANAPQDFEVVLNVAPANDPVKPDPQPAGLLFISDAAGAAPSQMVQVFANAMAPVMWQASASTADSNSWLSASPAMGWAAAGAPGQSTVSVNPAGLAPGVYRGGVSYALVGEAVRTVNVTLIIPSGAGLAPEAHLALSSLTASSLTPSAAVPACVPTKLVPTQTGITGNFAQPTSWPTPLSIRLVDDCGVAVAGGEVVATFSNGDPPLALTAPDPASGLYSGTWTPRLASSQVNISARASAAGFATATTTTMGQVTPNEAPVLTTGATLHIFAPAMGGALGPGNIVQIYGANLSAHSMPAPSIPLPRSLGGTSVVIGGIQAPLYYVSPGQINAQIPFELDPNKKYQIIVSANGALTTPDSIQLMDSSPGIAALPDGRVIGQHLDSSMSLITADSPAKPGEAIVFYMAGLGATDSPVSSGEATPPRLIRPRNPVSLSLNGANVPVLFAGLTPGLVGLYQVNFMVPVDAAEGDLQLFTMQGASQSNITTLSVGH